MQISKLNPYITNNNLYNNRIFSLPDKKFNHSISFKQYCSLPESRDLLYDTQSNTSDIFKNEIDLIFQNEKESLNELLYPDENSKFSQLNLNILEENNDIVKNSNPVTIAKDYKKFYTSTIKPLEQVKLNGKNFDISFINSKIADISLVDFWLNELNADTNLSKQKKIETLNRLVKNQSDNEFEKLISSTIKLFLEKNAVKNASNNSYLNPKIEKLKELITKSDIDDDILKQELLKQINDYSNRKLPAVDKKYAIELSRNFELNFKTNLLYMNAENIKYSFTVINNLLETVNYEQYDSIMDRLYKISSALNKKDNNELVNEWKELKKEIAPLWKANIYKNELDKRQADNKKINNILKSSFVPSTIKTDIFKSQTITPEDKAFLADLLKMPHGVDFCNFLRLHLPATGVKNKIIDNIKLAHETANENFDFVKQAFIWYINNEPNDVPFDFKINDINLLDLVYQKATKSYEDTDNKEKIEFLKQLPDESLDKIFETFRKDWLTQNSYEACENEEMKYDLDARTNEILDKLVIEIDGEKMPFEKYASDMLTGLFALNENIYKQLFENQNVNEQLFQKVLGNQAESANMQDISIALLNDIKKDASQRDKRTLEEFAKLNMILKKNDKESRAVLNALSKKLDTIEKNSTPKKKKKVGFMKKAMQSIQKIGSFAAVSHYACNFIHAATPYVAPLLTLL